MASTTSQKFDQDLLDFLFRGGSYTPPASYYLRACTDAVTVNRTTKGTECAYTGYVAGGVEVANGTGGFSRTDNEVSNAAQVQYGACTAGSENIKYIEIWKNNSSSDINDRIGWAVLASPFAVSSGKTPTFTIGSLKFKVVIT